MNLVLLAPGGLAALAAAAVPLLVHLARRAEGRPVEFAALRWLLTKPRPKRRPRFRERALLAARLLLLALIALWLARPGWRQPADKRAWVAAVPGIDRARVEAAAARARAVWLAPGFPPLDAPVPAGPVPVASLVRQLDAELPAGARLTLFVPPVIEGMDAARLRLSRAVSWRIGAGRMAAPPAAPDEAPAVALRYAPGVAGLNYLRAAIAALTPPGHRPDIAPVGAPLPPTGALVWWQAGAVPPHVRAIAAAGRAVLLPVNAEPPAAPVAGAWRDPLGSMLVERSGGLLRFVRPLTPAAVPQLLEPAFTGGLRAVLMPPLPPPARVPAADIAPDAGGAGGGSGTVPARDLRPWLVLAIVATALVERWLATRRRRAPAP